MTQIPIVNGTNGQTWMELWETEEYNNSKRLQWEAVDQYLNQSVGISCEIGCGQAYDSLWFQQAYNTDVYLIEGVSENNNQEQSRQGKFGQADNFIYYHSKAELNAEWDRLELKRTHLTPENCNKLKKSTTFDMVILENAYKQQGLPIPWQFWRVRDARTVYSLYPDLPKPKASHHALEDCKRQIDLLQQTLAYLGVKKLR